MGWENQYMHLVTTKPGIIVSEDERTLTPEFNRALLQKRGDYPRVLVEFGSGSGMHLLTLAEQNPDALCVGMEIRFKRAFRTGEKAQARGLQNVLVLRSDANHVMELFEPGTVHGFYINYPDPWAKRRWRKNRLIQADFIHNLHTLLIPSGLFRFKTDHHEYFTSSLPLFTGQHWNTVTIVEDLLASDHVLHNIPTEFEMLFKSQGKPLCMAEFRKISA